MLAAAANCKPRFPPNEAWLKVEQAWKYQSDFTDIWSRVKSIAEFCAEEDPSIQNYIKDIIVPGLITIIAAPRGIGKTHVLMALEFLLSQGGVFRGNEVTPLRVLHLDRDNPSRIIKQRIKSWFGPNLQNSNVKLLTRDEAPSLKDTKAWQSLPVKDYDVILLDSIGSFTEGITEAQPKQPKETTLAIANLLDVSHKGPAILALANCTKDALTMKGRGEWMDRADIIYEVRDATGFTASGKKSWSLELPSGAEADFADRANRRRSRTDYRLAFIPSKYRGDMQPDPFCLEINLPANAQWTITDVTDSLVANGKKFDDDNAQTENHGLRFLAAAVHKAYSDDKPMTKTAAENFLRDDLKDRITQKRARFLIESKDGEYWNICKVDGRSLGLYPVDAEGSSLRTGFDAGDDPSVNLNRCVAGMTTSTIQ